MILVAGGTGRLGAELVRRLASEGHPVRVLTRDPDRASRSALRARWGTAVELVRGDIRREADVIRAVAGVSSVVSAVQGFDGPGHVSPASVDRDGNRRLFAAARTVGAEVVLVSVAGADPASPMELFRMKHAAEESLRATTSSWTVVRPCAFLELWIEILRSTAARSGRPLVLGHGRNPISFVSVRDVAALVERAVLDRGLRGRTLKIGGPEDLTFTELADLVQRAAGRSSAPRHLPPALLRTAAVTMGRLSPSVGRKTRAALAMDDLPLTLDSRALRDELPGLPATTAAQLLDEAPDPVTT